jgi:hypothetical protein
MSTLDQFRAALASMHIEIESRYPLKLGQVTHRPLDGDDGWHVEFRIDAERHGPMDLLDLADLEEWIRAQTGFGVLIDTRSPAERQSAVHRPAAAE